MIEREKVVRGLELCAYDPDPGQELKEIRSCPECPYYRAGCYPQLIRDALALLKEQEARVIPLFELLTYDKKWQFNTPPYLCIEEIDAKRMWWRLWGEIYHSIRCEGTMGSNNYGTKWRCWTLHPTEEQRKAAKWDDRCRETREGDPGACDLY